MFKDYDLFMSRRRPQRNNWKRTPRKLASSNGIRISFLASKSYKVSQMDWFLGSLEFTYHSFAVRFEDRPQCFAPYWNFNDFRVTYSDLCALSLPKRYGLHRQLSICNCSSTTEYFRSINDAFERIHNVVSLKFRFSNDSDNINMITQYGEKIKSVTNVKFKLRTPHANPTIDCLRLVFLLFLRSH